MAITTAELFWICMLFKELCFPLSFAPALWCDNMSALALASNPIFHARTKHIEVDYQFICEKVVNGDICVKFISTMDQFADIFTKSLSSIRFATLQSKLMVLPSPISLRGDVKLSPNDQVEDHVDHKHVIQCPPDKASIHRRQSSLSSNHARNECHAICRTQKENKCYARKESKAVHNLMLSRITWKGKQSCTQQKIHVSFTSTFRFF
jgi:hypothetical protein